MDDGDEARVRWVYGQALLHEQIDVVDPKTRKLTKVWASRLRVQIFPAVVGVARVVPCPAGTQLNGGTTT